MLVQRSLKCAQGIHCEYVTPSHSVIQCPCSVSTWAQSRKLSAQVHSSEYYLGWVWQSWLIHKQGVILTAEVVYWESIPTPFTTVMKDCKKVFAWELEVFPVLARRLQFTKVDIMFTIRLLSDFKYALHCIRKHDLYTQELCLVHSRQAVEDHINFVVFREGRRVWNPCKSLTSDSSGVSISGKIQEEM